MNNFFFFVQNSILLKSSRLIVTKEISILFSLNATTGLKALLGEATTICQCYLRQYRLHILNCHAEVIYQ
jgi:hypothetical protein